MFISDINVPGMLHAVLIRSNVRSGKLLDIQLPKMPDGYFFFSAVDIPGKNSIWNYETLPVFASYEISYLGEPVGVIAGADLPTVEKLASETKLKIEKTQPLDFNKVFSKKQILEKECYKTGNVDNYFNNTENYKIIETKFTSEITTPFNLETEGVIIVPPQKSVQDSENSPGKSWKVYTPSQWTDHVINSLSNFLNIDKDKILVEPTESGEALDSKLIIPSYTACQAAAVAMISGKPVKLMYTRKEQTLYGPKCPPIRINRKTACDREGHIMAMDIKIFINCGAGNPLLKEMIKRMIVTSTGIYKTHALRVEAYGIKTNLVPFTAYTGWGESENFISSEAHAYEISEKLNIFPTEFKLLNACDSGSIILDSKQAKDKFSFADIIQKITLESDFPRKYSAFKFLSNRRRNFYDGPIKGIGISCSYQGENPYTVLCDHTYTVEATLEKDGTLIITADKTSKNMDQIWKNIACTQLELKPSSVQIKQNPHSVKNKAAPELHSVKISILTRLVELSINAIQKQRFRNPLPITVKRTVKIKKEDVINPQTKKNNPFYGIARGACIVEVEIDPLIYTIKIRDIWLAIDGGKIYSEKAVIRSLEKQVHNSLSKVLVEKFDDFFGKARGEYNPFYPILDFTKSPKPNIILIPSKNEPKGISRLPSMLIGGACMAAVSQAVDNFVESIPVTNKALYKIISPGS